MAAIEELRAILEAMDPDHPEYEEYKRTLEICQEFSHAIDEGFICVKEQQGEPFVFPAGECLDWKMA